MPSEGTGSTPRSACRGSCGTKQGLATDRIQIGSKGKSLIITRVTEGGLKPKSVGDAVVVLQSWRLGDLTCDRVKATPGEGSIRLKMAL
jgi:hypothetical protein